MGFQAAHEVEKFSIVPERVLTPPSAVVQQWSAGQTLPPGTAVGLPGMYSPVPTSEISMRFSQICKMVTLKIMDSVHCPR